MKSLVQKVSQRSSGEGEAEAEMGNISNGKEKRLQLEQAEKIDKQLYIDAFENPDKGHTFLEKYQISK